MRIRVLLSSLRALCVAGLLLLMLAVPLRVAPAQIIQGDEVSKFQLAQSHLRSGQYDRAITLLEDLHAEHPETQVFYDKLKESYENVKRYDDAIALVDSRLQQQRTPMFVADKARLIYLRGDEQEAFRTWDEAIQLAPDARSTYRVVYATLIDNRLFDKAIDVLLQGREALGEDDAFRSSLARLYSLTGRYEEAIEEHIQLLGEDENKLSLVRSRLARFTDKEEALRHYIAGMRRAVREKSLYRPFRELLAWLHMEAEQYPQALDAIRAVDRLEQEEGTTLYSFSRRMASAGAYDVALEGYREILNRYPDAPIAPQALLGLGVMHEQWAEKNNEHVSAGSASHYEQALASYESFLQEYPGHNREPEVHRRMGRLQLDVFRNLDAAQSTLRKVVQDAPNTPAAHRARYDLGRLALLRNELDAARLAFSRLEEELGTSELADKARYELALLHFYQGEFETALTLTNAINQNTSKDIANDGIELKVLLVENKGPDSLNTPLRKYAEARLLNRQHRSQQALQVLNELLHEHGRHPLADDTRFLRAATLRDMGRVEEALAAYLEFPLTHPKSPLADRSLFRAARLQEHELGDVQAAQETYQRLLTEHPGSLLASDARARIRALRGDGV